MGTGWRAGSPPMVRRVVVELERRAIEVLQEVERRGRRGARVVDLDDLRRRGRAASAMISPGSDREAAGAARPVDRAAGSASRVGLEREAVEVAVDERRDLDAGDGAGPAGEAELLDDRLEVGDVVVLGRGEQLDALDRRVAITRSCHGTGESGEPIGWTWYSVAR